MTDTPLSHTETVLLNQAFHVAQQLDLRLKLRLVRMLMEDIENSVDKPKPERKSLYGIIPDMRVSEEDIADARREMMAHEGYKYAT